MNISFIHLHLKEKLMRSNRNFGAVFVALVLNLLLELHGNNLGAEAADNNNNGAKLNNLKSPIGKHNQHHHHPSHSDNVKHSDGIPFSAEREYQYLLPEQTIFDSPDELVASQVLLTSPPRLTIQPSHVDHSYKENLLTNKQFGHHSSNGALISISHSLKPEACVSETPTFPFVASSFPSELRTGIQYSITAGRVETASSTDSLNDMPVHIASKMSQPSTVLLQGTTVTTRSLAELQKK